MLELSFLGEAIVKLRSDRFSQRKAAERASVPVGTWNQWEKGKRCPRKSQLKKILIGLDCTEEDLRAIIWRLQGEAFVMRGSDLGPIARQALESYQNETEDELSDPLKGIPDEIRPVLYRIRERISALEIEHEALIQSLKRLKQKGVFERKLFDR